MRFHIITLMLAVFAAGIVTGLIIAIIIQAHIMQMDFIYPTGRMIWA
jgi:hypothetical protein